MPAAVPALVITGSSSTYSTDRVDLGQRVPPGQLPGVPPVCGAAPPVQQAGRAERERPGAHAEHAAAAVHRRAQGSQQRSRELPGAIGQPGIAQGGDRDQVGIGQPVQAE